MKPINLELIIERSMFNGALYFLNHYRKEMTIDNDDIHFFIDQMLYNEREYFHHEEENHLYVVINIDFKDELHVQVIGAFLTAICAEAMKNNCQEMYDVGLELFSSLMSSAYDVDKKLYDSLKIALERGEA